MLNKSKLHLDPVGTKVLVNNIYKVVSQWLAEVCEVKKLRKMEDVSNSNSSLSYFKDLAIENPGRCYGLTENKSSNTFQKLKELRLENPRTLL